MEFRSRKGIVIIGAQKAASTSFQAVLSQHPDLTMLPEEFHGFSVREDDALTCRLLGEAFEGLPDRPWFGFKCASYLGEPSLAPRLVEAFGDIHFVVLLRDPVARAISAWYWYGRTGLLPIMDHERGLRAVLDGQEAEGRWRHAREILAWGEYGRLIAQWADAVPPGRLHVITETGLSDLRTTIGDFLANVGLDPTVPMELAVGRLNPGITSVARLRWLSLRLRVRWQVDETGVWRMSRPKAILPWLFDTFVSAFDRLVLARIFRRQATLTPDLRQRLEDYYREDQALLEELPASVMVYPRAGLTART